MSNSENSEPTIEDIINEIKEKSSDGDYIYRGERRLHDDVSSALYREYFNNKNFNIDLEGFDLTYVQKEMLHIAKKHIGEPPKTFREDIGALRKPRMRNVNELIILEAIRRSAEEAEEAEELEILTELQHYGGKTNLIDFTTDYLIAIFFACAGDPEEDGRVIMLEKNEEIEKMMIRPLDPQHRVIAQKSVFLHPPTGLINVSEDNKVTIPAILKEPFRKYLDKYHNISAETIYNDIHGFIRYQNIHQNFYLHFFMGLTLHYRGFKAKSPEDRQSECEKAITHYDEAIRLKPDYEIAYHNRGECWLYLQEWEKAKIDFTIAQDMGSDIAEGFRNDYKGGVKEFELKTGVEVPPNLAEMLGN